MVQLWRAFGDLVPLFLIVVLAFSITAYFVSRKRNLDSKRMILKILFALNIIAILLVTVFPMSYGLAIPRVINLVPLVGMYDLMFNSVDISVPIRNLGLNILLFVPFGFFLSLKKPSLQKKLILNVIIKGFLLSLFIEVVQYAFPMGRSADIDDLILNTVGTFLGYIIWRLFISIFSTISISNKTTERHL